MPRQRLPKEVFTVLGNIPLRRDPGSCPDDCRGVFDTEQRYVAIHQETSKETEWPTYWHEAAHVALDDSGCSQHLTSKQQEAICDAMGTYLAAMMQAGMLRVVTPRTRTKKGERK